MKIKILFFAIAAININFLTAMDKQLNTINEIFSKLADCYSTSKRYEPQKNYFQKFHTLLAYLNPHRQDYLLAGRFLTNPYILQQKKSLTDVQRTVTYTIINNWFIDTTQSMLTEFINPLTINIFDQHHTFLREKIFLKFLLDNSIMVKLEIDNSQEEGVKKSDSLHRYDIEYDNTKTQLINTSKNYIVIRLMTNSLEKTIYVIKQFGFEDYFLSQAAQIDNTNPLYRQQENLYEDFQQYQKLAQDLESLYKEKNFILEIGSTSVVFVSE